MKIGDSIQLSNDLSTYARDYTNEYTAQVSAHLVGLFQVSPQDAYWNGYTLEQPPAIAGVPPPPVLALIDQGTLLKTLDAINAPHQGSGVFPARDGTNSLLLSYTTDTSHIVSNQLSDIIASLGNLQQAVSQNYQNSLSYLSGGNISTVDLSGPLVHDPIEGTDSILEKFQSQVQITQAPALILTAQILALILFFVSVIVSALVEREQTAIAVLRSRGANRRQVSGSLLTQGLVLCILAGLLGPLLALGLTCLIAPFLLTPATRDALNALTLHTGPIIHSLVLYTLGAVVAAFVTLFLSIFLSVRANILTQRREEARATHQPLWQRLRLDMLIAVLALAGYAVTYYLESTRQLLSLQSQSLITTPLELLAPLLLLITGILFFLRFFPRLLNWLARMAQRRQGLSSMLALAQMARAPRQAMRMALLLGLASAFTLFSLVFAASQGQRAQDLATYQAVSDFSGYNNSNLPVTSLRSSTSVFSDKNTVLGNARSALSQATSLYQQIQGVSVASVGSVNHVYLSLNAGTAQATTWSTRLIAVDPATFARTAYWDEQDSDQSLADLMQQLISQRAQAIQQGVVPAIVASTTWDQLGLSQGMTFHLTTVSGNVSPTTYVALAEVKHIPPVDDGSEGAILVDYQSLVAGQIQGQGMTQVTVVAQLNYVWLRSGDDLAAVNHVRAALQKPALALAQLLDRRLLSGGNAKDPLANSLISTLSIGVAATLLLAFLANLLLPLLSVRMRLTNFAVLRALGTNSSQVVGILTWELAIVLATALVLGLLFGALLAFTSVPPLVFTGALPTALVSLSSSAIYTLQQIIPVTIVMPFSLVIALLCLLALCLIALGLMTRLVQRPLMAQVLRLDED
jgi:ABC-type antimicrobial peptide transport system permease subunit